MQSHMHKRTWNRSDSWRSSLYTLNCRIYLKHSCCLHKWGLETAKSWKRTQETKIIKIYPDYFRCRIDFCEAERQFHQSWFVFNCWKKKKERERTRSCFMDSLCSSRRYLSFWLPNYTNKHVSWNYWVKWRKNDASKP
jgi:hypothetical protein